MAAGKITRGPLLTVVLALCIAVGLIIGSQLMQRDQTTDAQEKSRHPDIELRSATVGGLVAAGFKLTGKEPRTWRDIDLRMVSSSAADVLFMHCRISATQADALCDFSAGSWRPGDDMPPPSWYRDAHDRARMEVPTWWVPRPQRGRVHERYAAQLHTGIYAGYDAIGEQLWLWRWTLRSATAPPPRAPGINRVAIALAETLARTAPGREGWIHGTDLPVTGFAAVVHADLSLRTVAGSYRMLLRMAPLSAATAAALVADLPVRSIRDDSLPPAWVFARPNEGDCARFIAIGPGPRWAASVVQVGSGRVESARWAGYDHTTSTLVVWDWREPGWMAADADPLR